MRDQLAYFECWIGENTVKRTAHSLANLFRWETSSKRLLSDEALDLRKLNGDMLPKQLNQIRRVNKKSRHRLLPIRPMTDRGTNLVDLTRPFPATFRGRPREGILGEG
jgi:hypothetical protein